MPGYRFQNEIVVFSNSTQITEVEQFGFRDCRMERSEGADQSHFKSVVHAGKRTHHEQYP
jgi:hypothetical protein